MITPNNKANTFSRRASKLSSNRSGRFSNKRSLNSDNMGEERKLFEDLGKIGDEEDMLLYQDDFKKFETHKSYNSSLSQSSLTKDRKNNFLRKGLSRFETLKIGSKPKKGSKIRRKYKRFSVNKIYNKRRLCRVLTICCFLVFMIVLVIVLYFFGYHTDQFKIEDTDQIELELDNCRVFMSECEDCT